jgi:hypothetical protein
MTTSSSTRRQNTVQAIAKWAVLLAGLAYTGFVTRLFEQDLGWHLAPVGLLMVIGSLYAAAWVERSLAERIS